MKNPGEPLSILLLGLAAALGWPVGAAASSNYFGIHVIDAASSRGLPLVRTRTVNAITQYTDSGGWIAFNEPGLMDREVWFEFDSDGYERPTDGFGMRGATLKTTPGTTTTVTLHRAQPAQRLYRITGAGIYRDSVLLGIATPIRDPILRNSVLGQDSALTALWNGRMFWIWGDTSHPRNPLAGNFKATGATSLLPGSGGLDPDVGVEISYFSKDDYVRPMVPWPPPDHPHWIGPLVPANDSSGKEHLVAYVAEIRPPMDTAARFLAEWDEQTTSFVQKKKLGLDDIIRPNGQPARVRDKDGTEYFFFADSLKFARVRATYEAVCNAEAYEAYTCLETGKRFAVSSENLNRNVDGRLKYDWKKATEPIGQVEEDKLLSAGLIRASDRSFDLRDEATSKPITVAGASIAWNEWRGKWFMIFTRIFGSDSLLGEVWYAESDAPQGPYSHARKIATHKNYSFYNPLQHPEFAKERGRVIYFEGTYTKTFTNNDAPVPRYEYNQLMYRLELDDPMLQLSPGKQFGH